MIQIVATFIKNWDDDLMFRIFLVLVILFINYSMFAQTDTSVAGYLRSYPLTGVIEGQVGHSFVLWENRKLDEILFGYIRPFASYQFITGYSGSNFGFDFFPISILGVRVLSERGENSKDYTPYNCNTRLCRGVFSRKSIELFGAYGWGNFFGIGRFKKGQRELVSSSNGVSEYVDSGLSAALLTDEKNNLTTHTFLIGRKWGETFKTSILYQVVEHSKVGKINRLSTINFHYDLKIISVLFGLGNMESQLKENSLSILASLTWNIKPKLGIF